jgi:signal transduction histidine kinase
MFRRGIILMFGLVVMALIVGAAVATFIAITSRANVWLVIGVAILAVLCLGALARIVLRRNFAPVGELIDATRRLGDGDTGVRIRSFRPGPLAAVGASFNRMAERLEAEDERRRRFLADVSHEMRTPLTVIRGEVEAVLDGLHAPESLSLVLAEVDLMDRLLDDLRVLAMAEAGRLTLHPEPTDLPTLVSDVVATHATTMETQDVKLELQVGDDIPELNIDPQRVRQILNNVVSNALKQMPEGGVLQISARADENTVDVLVADTGPGIPTDQLEAIFERFVRSGDTAGTGLGLSIARDLAVAHDGSLVAENRPRGAIFTLSLPIGA